MFVLVADPCEPLANGDSKKGLLKHTLSVKTYLETTLSSNMQMTRSSSSQQMLDNFST
jgi:hypothetical protein